MLQTAYVQLCVYVANLLIILKCFAALPFNWKPYIYHTSCFFFSFLVSVLKICVEHSGVTSQEDAFYSITEDTDGQED